MTERAVGDWAEGVDGQLVVATAGRKGSIMMAERRVDRTEVPKDL